MSIKEIIESFVLALDVNGETFKFGHGTKGFQNLMSDEELFPAVYLDRPLISKDKIFPGGLILEEFQVVLMFMYKTELDFTPDQQDEAVQITRIAKNQFLSMVNKSALFQNFTLNNTIEFFNEFDVNTSGVLLAFNCTPKQNKSVCV